MSTRWLDRYVDAWVQHGRAGGGDAGAMDALLGFMSADIRYEDVPTGALFHGHDGVRAMAAQAYRLSADLTFHPKGLAVGDGCFAFENGTRGTQTGAIGTAGPTGASFVIRGVSVGAFRGDRVTEHRDYWDLSSYLAQLGTA